MNQVLFVDGPNDGKVLKVEGHPAGTVTVPIKEPFVMAAPVPASRPVRDAMYKLEKYVTYDLTFARIYLIYVHNGVRPCCCDIPAKIVAADLQPYATQVYRP